MPHLALELIVDRVDLVDEGANSAAFIELYKRKEIPVIMDFEAIMAKMAPEDATVIREAVAKAKGEIPAETAAEMETLRTEKQSSFDELENMKKAKQELEEEVKKSKSEPDFDEVMKSADPAVQAVFKSMKLQKEAAETAVRQAAETAATAEATAKAKELKSIPVDEATMVAVLKSASPEMVEVLKAASAAIENSELFDEVGKSKLDGKPNGSKEAWAKIEKRAGEIAKERSITVEKATSVVMKEEPALYKEYLAGGAN